MYIEKGSLLELLTACGLASPAMAGCEQKVQKIQ